MDKATDAPVDRHRMVYVVFYWLGVGTLLPWNFFISVPAYWDYKYRNVSDSNVTEQTPLQLTWNSRLAVTAMLPNVTFLILNAVFGHKFRAQPRIIGSLFLIIAMFIYSSIMAEVNTDEWQSAFFYTTLITVVLINVGAAIFQGGLFGLSGKFPAEYIGGVFSGQALGGIFASLTNVILLALGAGGVGSAFFCFVIASVYLAVALVLYLYMVKSPFFKHYSAEEEKKGTDLVTVVDAENDTLVKKPPGALDDDIPVKVDLKKICGEISVYALSVFFVFFVTLGCFPGITALIQSTGTGSAWADTFFVPVICFMGFNLGDYAGRFGASVLQYPPKSRWGSLIILGVSIARIAFVPLFLFCNASPRNRNLTGVFFFSDTFYIILMALFSLSNGYLSSLCMMHAPKMMERPEEQGAAASIMTAVLGVGLVLGAAMSNVYVMLL